MVNLIHAKSFDNNKLYKKRKFDFIYLYIRLGFIVLTQS